MSRSLSNDEMKAELGVSQRDAQSAERLLINAIKLDGTTDGELEYELEGMMAVYEEQLEEDRETEASVRAQKGPRGMSVSEAIAMLADHQRLLKTMEDYARQVSGENERMGRKAQSALDSIDEQVREAYGSDHPSTSSSKDIIQQHDDRFFTALVKSGETEDSIRIALEKEKWLFDLAEIDSDLKMRQVCEEFVMSGGESQLELRTVGGRTPTVQDIEMHLRSMTPVDQLNRRKKLIEAILLDAGETSAGIKRGVQQQKLK